MIISAAPTYAIGVLLDLRRSDKGMQMTFQDGSVYHLDEHHPSFGRLLWLAEWSRSGRHVGVAADVTGRIHDLNAAHDTGVAWLRELPSDPDRIRVAFWAYSPLCGLTRNHPEFNRIHATLAAAAGTTQPLWVATFTEETVDDEPDEEGMIAALPKIMDVRPI